MLLPHAIICLPNSQGSKYIAIPVINFPVLPIGSFLNLYLCTKFIDEARISRYTASNRYGTVITVTLDDKKVMDNKMLDEIWDLISRSCIVDITNACDLVYLHPIDFGAKFPLPPI